MSALLEERLERRDLVELFAPTLGVERGAEAVDAAARALQLDGPLSVDQAVAVLTEMGRAPGLVRLVARLAIARLRAGQAYRGAGGAPRPM